MVASFIDPSNTYQVARKIYMKIVGKYLIEERIFWGGLPDCTVRSFSLPVTTGPIKYNDLGSPLYLPFFFSSPYLFDSLVSLHDEAIVP